MIGSFFGVQIALDLPLDHALRQQLADVVHQFRGASGVPAQRAHWTRIAGLLASGIATARFGTWDLIRDRGQAEYEDWASGLEAMAQWPASDFGDDGRYLLVSLIMLVAAGSNADRTLGDICDIPESAWQSRRTYRSLVAAAPMLNFTNVQSSGMYLAPRPEQPGFSEAVLRGDGFEYLIPIGG